MHPNRTAAIAAGIDVGAGGFTTSNILSHIQACKDVLKAIPKCCLNAGGGGGGVGATAGQHKKNKGTIGRIAAHGMVMSLNLCASESGFVCAHSYGRLGRLLYTLHTCIIYEKMQ